MAATAPVALTPEAQAILDKAKKKKPAAPPKPTKEGMDKSIKTAPKIDGESLSVADRMAGIVPTLKQVPRVLDDALRVGLGGTTAGALDWGLEKSGLEPEARKTTAEARSRVGHPKSLEAVGAILPALAGAPALAMLASKTPGLLGTGARMGLSALEGAGYGATSAATSLDPNASVGWNALLGAGFGAGGQALGEGVSAGAKWLKGPDPAEAVAETFAKNPNAARQLAALGPEGIVADVGGEEGRTLMRGVADKSPEARQILLNTTEPRQARQPQNIIASVEDAAQIAPEHRSTPRQLKAEAREHYRPAIDEAYQSATAAGKNLDREQRVQSRFVQDEPGTAVLEEGARNVTPPRGSIVNELVDTETPRFFGDLLETPVGREAWAHAKVKLANMKPTHGERVGGDFWMLNEVQKYISHKANGAYKLAQSTGDFSQAEIYGPVAKSFKERMDGFLDLPQYADARKLHTEMKDDLRAIDRGAQLAEPRYPATLPREAMAARESPRGNLLGAAQAQGYGHAKAAQLRGNRSLNQDIGSFRSQLSQEGAHAALGERADIIDEAVRRADTFDQTHKAIGGGSQTSRNLQSPLLQAIKENSLPAIFSSAPIVYGIMSGNKAALASGATAIMGWAASKGYSALRARQLAENLPEIARILTSRDIPKPTPFRASPGAITAGSVASRGGLLGVR